LKTLAVIEPMARLMLLAIACVLKHRRGLRLLLVPTYFVRRQQLVSCLYPPKKLDGIYVIRTNVPAASMPAAEVVRSYKQLSGVERAFRSLKTVDLHVRPIHHRLAERVRAHVFLCMLAYYVEWHMRNQLASLLFDDHDKATALAQRDSVVQPAKRSPAAERKALTKQTAEGKPVHSFQSLLADLATLTLNRIQPANQAVPAFDKLANPTALHELAFSALGLKVRVPTTYSVISRPASAKYLLCLQILLNQLRNFGLVDDGQTGSKLLLGEMEFSALGVGNLSNR
jgi:hypothetical protein